MLKARRLRIAVMNQAQHVRGIRSQVFPSARMRAVVVTKLIALNTLPIQNRPMLASHRSVPRFWPGPVVPMALSGGYCVHQAIEAPPGTKNAESSTSREVSVVQKLMRF